MNLSEAVTYLECPKFILTNGTEENIETGPSKSLVSATMVNIVEI